MCHTSRRWHGLALVAWMDVNFGKWSTEEELFFCVRSSPSRRSPSLHRFPTMPRSQEGLPPVPNLPARSIHRWRPATRAGDSDGAMINRARPPAQPATQQVTAATATPTRAQHRTSPARRCRCWINGYGASSSRARVPQPLLRPSAAYRWIDACRCRPLN